MVCHQFVTFLKVCHCLYKGERIIDEGPNLRVSLFNLFQEAREQGCQIWIEKGKVPPRLIQGYKKEIEEYFELEEVMKKRGWLVGYPLESYQYQLSRNHFIYIFGEEGTFQVVRATFYKEWKDPIKEINMGYFGNLLDAALEAKKYIEWYQRKRRRR